MQLIKPNSISGAIMDLFDEAEKKVIIVSPYCKFTRWYKLLNRFESLRSRNIEIEFYVRDGEIKSIQEVRDAGIQPISIPYLHSKLYMNEKSAIVTSMNLLFSSDTNNLEIGYKTETAAEYKELVDYYNIYLNKRLDEDIISNDWLDKIKSTLSSEFASLSIFYDKGDLRIKTFRSNYYCRIEEVDCKNSFWIRGILSNIEFEKAKTMDKEFEIKTNLRIQLNPGAKGNYDTISGNLLKSVKSNSIEKVFKSDQEVLTSSVIKFVIEVERLKESILF